MYKHTSKLIGSDPGVARALQLGKVQNLRVAIAELDGIVIAPGEQFSFCRLVGRPTRERGFVDGIELVRGVPRPGVGGGLCQAANMIHWLVLHSELTVVERHGHGFDPFPDNGRVLPFGSGATIFYNYLDYRFSNETPASFQLRLWLADNQLHGELRASSAPRLAYRVYDRGGRFVREHDRWYREKEMWRQARVRDTTGTVLGDTLLYRHRAEVKYAVTLQP
ncbi:VanW family protein [soil metagenome]